MGESMARRLLPVCAELWVYNRSASAAQSLIAQGARVAQSPAEAAARASVVFVCVANDAATREVLLSPDSGALGAMRSGSRLVDCGTSSPALTAELAERAASRGVRFLDAPITGSMLGARNGTLTFMVGGEASDVEACRPYFAAMGKHVVHVGACGKGQAAKLCLNASQAVVLQGVLEGYSLAAATGVPLSKMAEVFENSAGRTGVGAFKTSYLRDGDFAAHFKLALMAKDLHLAHQAAQEQRLTLPALSTLLDVYDRAIAEGLGEQDFLATAKLLEADGGVVLRGEGAPPSRGAAG